MNPFLICCLPRSRSAWLANWLTWGGVRCGHDMLAECASVRDLAGRLDHRFYYSGDADTAGAIVLPELLHFLPFLRVVVIRRPVGEVYESLWKLGVPMPPGALDALEWHLGRAVETPGALVVEFDDLRTEHACRAILEHIAPGQPFDRERWQMLQNFNVQLTREALLSGIRRGYESPFAENLKLAGKDKSMPQTCPEATAELGKMVGSLPLFL